MKRIYEFIFFCLYAMVPKKSMYGQKNAAVVLISLVDCAIATGIYFLAMVFLNREISNKPFLLTAIGVITVTSFVFNSKFFESGKEFKEVLDAFGPIRISHRFLGAAIFISVFVMYLFLIRFLDLYVTSHQ